MNWSKEPTKPYMAWQHPCSPRTSTRWIRSSLVSALALCGEWISYQSFIKSKFGWFNWYNWTKLFRVKGVTFLSWSPRIVEDVPIISEDVRENFRRCSQFFSRFWESLEEVPLFCVHCSFLALGWVYVYFESVSVKANAAQSFQWGVIDLSASLSWHVRGFFHPQACWLAVL